MNLPPLSIPDTTLPFAIPHMIHPLLVHFAIALPVLIVLFEIVNLAFKKRAVGVTSFLLIILLVVAYIGAYFAGITDGQEAKKFLTPEAKDALVAHKQLGIYLVYGSIAVLLFKIISASVNKFPARLVFLLVLIGFTLLAFNEGKKGGELVYEYGANVKTVTSQVKTESNEKDAAVSAKAEDKTPQSEEKSVEKEEAKVVTDATKDVTEKATGTVKDATETVKDKATETVDKAKNVAKKAIETVKENASELKDKAEKAVEKLVNPATEAPTKVITPADTIPAG